MAEHDTNRYSDFDMLAARHQGIIKSLCWWYAGGKSEVVADLIQEVLAHLWHYRHTLRPDATAAQERQWVRLHCRSVFEHMRRRPGVETVPLEEAQHVTTGDESHAELIDRLAADLTGRERQVLEWVLDGYTDGEVAAMLHTSTVEARRLHNTVIEKMREKAGNM